MGVWFWLLTGRWAVVESKQEPARGVPVTETNGGKLYAKLTANGKCYTCADCSAPLQAGPEGGMSVNMRCSNKECRSKFNVTPFIRIADRIGKAEPQDY